MKFIIALLVFLTSAFCLLYSDLQPIDDDWVLANYAQAGITLRDVAEIGSDPTTAWVVGDEGNVLKLTDEIVDSQNQPIGDQYDFYGVSFVDYQHGWICGTKHDSGEEGILLKTTNGGGVWNDVTPQVGSNTLAFYDVAFWDANTGYVACSDGYVLKSTNGGVTWTETLYKPYYPLSDDSTICITHIELTSAKDVWCVGDNMGVLAHSQNSGQNWITTQPFDTSYNDLPDAGGIYEGRMANFVICPINSDDAYVGLSHGRYGWTTDGGSTWDFTLTKSKEQWDYGVGSFISQFTFGSSGTIYIDGPPVLYYTKNFNLYGNSTHDKGFGPECHYAVGSDETIVFFRGWLPWIPELEISDMSLALIPSSGNTDKVRVDWKVHNGGGSSVNVQFVIHHSFSDEGPFTDIKDISLDVPSGDTWFSWDHDIEPDLPDTPYNTKRWYYVTMNPGYDYQQEIGIKPNGQSINTASHISDFAGADAGDDNGWNTELTWDYDPYLGDPPLLTVKFYLYKEPKRIGERVTFMDSLSGAEEFIDTMALTGYPFGYKIRRSIKGGTPAVEVAYSNANTISNIRCHDEVAPDSVRYIYYHYDPDKNTLYVVWEALQDSTLGGYWFCPNLKEDGDQTHSLGQLAPITRTWYKDYYIDWETGQYGLVAVCAMDRSYNVGPWNDKYIQVALATASNLNATYANNGERFQRDTNGNMYLAFTSGNPDSVYFSKSTDGGKNWAKEIVSEGSYPVLALYGTYLHLLWIEDKDTDHAKLMYAWKSLTDQNFSTAVCLLNINTDPSIESIGSPSLAVSRDSVFVTWESGMSSPIALPHGLYMGSIPNTRTASPPFNYQMLDSGNSIHKTFPFGTDTIIQLQTPSIAVSKTKNPYIVWNRLDNITHCFDIVSWKRQLGIWTKEIVSNTASWKDEVEPYLTYEDGVLHCVWSGTENNGNQPFNIYHSQKTPGQFGTAWRTPETINNSQVHSFTPVYESGNAIWSENNTSILIQTYDSDSFDWQTSPPETIAKADSEYNMNPIATSGDDSLFTVWSNEDRFSNFYIHYDERSMLGSPLFAANLGDTDPSPFTVERNGRIVHGNSFYKTADYDSNALVYEIRDLEPKPGQHFKLTLYHEGNVKCKLRVKVDNTWTTTVWVPPLEPFSVEGNIPMPCLVDSQIDIAIEPLEPANAHAVCSAFWIYEKANGGPMLSGENTAPLIYSLKTACPNPFKGNTMIYYAIEKRGIVSLKVYDITGRCIKTLENGIKDPGRYSARWNGCDNKNHKLATGVYFTRLVSGNFISTKKVILVR